MSTATASKPSAGPACYVYGVVPATAPEPAGTEGVGNPPSPVTLVRTGRVAALVSDVDAARTLGTPDDLRAHARVLDAVAADFTPVLPFRFGGVLNDRRAVAEDLLGPSEADFAAALDELGDLVQFTVRGVYRQDRVLARILDERPDIARLRDQTRDLPPDAGHPQQVRLGELVSQELAARREADAGVLMDRLAPLAAAASGGSASNEQAVDASFLVHRAERVAFEDAADEVARQWADRVELRLLGPLAPYDFAAAVVDQIREA